MVCYKVYEHSPKATAISGGFGFLAFTIFFIMLLVGVNSQNFILAIVGTVIGIILYIVGAKVSNKIAIKDYEKMLEKKVLNEKGLLETNVQETLRYPAKIIINRKKAFYGVLVGLKYIVNDKDVFIIKNNQSATITTYQAINQIYVENLASSLNETRTITFSVKEAQTIEVNYKLDKFIDFTRR